VKMASQIKVEGHIIEAMAKILPAPRDPAMLDEQRRLADNAREGKCCPCCGQFVKVYPRKLNANMVAFLISLFREHRRTKDWVHHSKCFHVGRDYPYSATWGLATTKPNEDDSSKRESGLWQTTKKGRFFLQKRVLVPSHVFMYNNSIVGWSAKRVGVIEALGKKFNYQELMNGKVPE